MVPISKKMQGIILAITGYSVFAFADVCVKSTSATLDILNVAFYLNIFTAAFLIPTAIMSGGIKKSIKTPTLKFHFLRSILMLGNFLCIIYAIGQLPIASFYVIIFLIPFAINILSFLILKEKISFYRWLAIGFCFCGIIVALRPESIPLNLATLIAFISVFLNSSATITVKFINKTDHWLSYPIYLMIFQTPIIIALMIWQNVTFLPPEDTKLLIWLIVGGASYSIGLTIMPQAVQRIDASLVGSTLYIVFPWGLFYGYFIFGDVIDFWTALGAVIIIFSGLFLIYRERIEKRKRAELD